jgi:hypothetical protein
MTMKCKREFLDETRRIITPAQESTHAISAFRCISPVVVIAGMILLLWTTSRPAQATASFSRQTGLACSTCHTTFPELTPFGRDFKLNGYTLSSAKEVTEKGEKKQSGLSILESLPLSINLRGALTQTGNRQDYGELEYRTARASEPLVCGQALRSYRKLYADDVQR